MKQEHRLVAEFYRYVAPFIDTTKEIYLSLDGQAARTAVGSGRFVDPDIPDLWFTLIGAAQPTRIEAKILDKGAALLMQSQILAWRSSGAGTYKPESWVAANREFTEFYFWPHAAFCPSLPPLRSGCPSLPRLAHGKRRGMGLASRVRRSQDVRAFQRRP